MLAAFPRLRVLVVGDAILDEFVVGTATRLCRERPVPVVRTRAEHAFPGGAANTAANLRALGAQVRFVSALAFDDAGRRLRELLRGRDITVSGIVDAPDARTGRKRRLLADGHYLARIDDDPEGFDCVYVQRELVARVRDAFDDCDAIVISDYEGGVVGPFVLRALEELCEGRAVPVVVDARDPGRYAAIDVDVLTPNLEEAAFLAGMRSSEIAADTALVPLARRLTERVRARAIAVTLGDDGVCVVENGEPQHIAGRRVAVDNTCGAGDSFVAALALGIAAGAETLEAARIGLEAAAVAVAKPYTATVSLAELRERLELLGAVAPPAPLTELEAAAARVRARRENGERVVLTNGVFDLLHAGHVHLLRRARALGDLLVVALNSDASAARIKGPNRPITEHAQRRAVLEALDWVDEVVTFDGATAEEVIEAIRPDVYVRGDDWPLEDLPEARTAERIGAEVVLLPLVGDVTTSRIIERVAARTPHWSPAAKT
jgi:D-beta-D-heptose 7-phosphate kinase/D-beta-D-heptose 1-phosphate adenosyltransferase